MLGEPVTRLFARVAAAEYPSAVVPQALWPVAPVAVGGFPFGSGWCRRVGGGTMKEAPISEGRDILSSQTELHETTQAKKDLDPIREVRASILAVRPRG